MDHTIFSYAQIIAAEFVHSIYMHHVETAKGHWLAANVGYNCP